jgi:hypothetical protein
MPLPRWRYQFSRLIRQTLSGCDGGFVVGGAFVAVRALAGVAPRCRPDEGDPDAVLVVAARAEAGRFVALYERYFGPVHRYVRMRVPERAASEDITSDVFLTALSKLGEFRGNGSFAAWLFRIAQNAVRDELRRRHTAEDESALALLVDPRPGPEAQALRNDRLRGLLVVLSREQQESSRGGSVVSTAWPEQPCVGRRRPADLTGRGHARRRYW